jgi:hypothetical protein
MSASDDYPNLANLARRRAGDDDTTTILVHPFQEQSAEALDELDRLRRWKQEAITVLGGWEECWIAAGSPGPLGESRAVNTRDRIAALQAEVQRLRIIASTIRVCTR